MLMTGLTSAVSLSKKLFHHDRLCICDLFLLNILFCIFYISLIRRNSYPGAYTNHFIFYDASVPCAVGYELA